MNRDLEAVSAVVNLYFEGIHWSDPKRIEEAFHPDARLVGHIGSTPYAKGRGEYMEILRSRPAPAASGAEFTMTIQGIDIYRNAAVVRTRTPIGGVVYVDYLSLRKSDGVWKIVHKVFSHEPGPD